MRSINKILIVSIIAGWHVHILRQLVRAVPALMPHLEHTMGAYNSWGIREALKIRQRLDISQKVWSK